MLGFMGVSPHRSYTVEARLRQAPCALHGAIQSKIANRKSKIPSHAKLVGSTSAISSAGRSRDRLSIWAASLACTAPGESLSRSICQRNCLRIRCGGGGWAEEADAVGRGEQGAEAAGQLPGGFLAALAGLVADQQPDDAGVRRQALFLAQGQFAGGEAVVVVLDGQLDGRLVGVQGLDDDLARPLVPRPARPATCTMSWNVRSAARKSGMASDVSAETTPTS